MIPVLAFVILKWTPIFSKGESSDSPEPNATPSQSPATSRATADDMPSTPTANPKTSHPASVQQPVIGAAAEESEAVGEGLHGSVKASAEDDDDFLVTTPGNHQETVNYTPKTGTGNTTGTIIIKAGQSKGVLRISPVEDATVEPDETVKVEIIAVP